MVKNVLKFSWKILLIVIVAAGLIQSIQYIRYRGSTEYQIKKEIEAIKLEYAEDPYGGDTPEETLRLFVEALKQGDTDLAAKHFVLDEQDKWREDLAKIKEKNLLGEMVRDLERTKKSNGSVNEQFFTVTNEENIVSVLIKMVIAPNDKWKIQDL